MQTWYWTAARLNQLICELQTLGTVSSDNTVVITGREGLARRVFPLYLKYDDVNLTLVQRGLYLLSMLGILDRGTPGGKNANSTRSLTLGVSVTEKDVERINNKPNR